MHLDLPRWALSAVLPACLLTWLSATPGGQHSDLHRPRHHHRLEPLPSLPLPLEGFFNNKGTSKDGSNNGEGFDGGGSTYPVDHLPTGKHINEGVEFDLPTDWTVLPYDNIVTVSQVIPTIEPVEVASIHLLVAGDGTDGETKEKLELAFENGSKEVVEIDVKNFWAIHWLNKALIRCPYHFVNGPDATRNYNVSHIHHVKIPVRSTEKLTSIALPPRSNWNALHVFAATLVPAERNLSHGGHDHRHPSPPLRVRRILGTRKWVDLPSKKSKKYPHRAQIVEVTLVNPYSSRLHSDHRAWILDPVSISLAGGGVKTVRAATVERLQPADEVTVQILVAGERVREEKEEVDEGELRVEFVPVDRKKGRIAMEVDRAAWVEMGVQLEGSELVIRSDVDDSSWEKWEEWEDDAVSLEEHTTPDWWNGAKFGIFIHFGLFSVPAWTDPGRYAEWYWWWQHSDGIEGGTAQHHLKKYGADFKYDDFIPYFDGSKFNATEWIEAFNDFGAKYFVLTTKHHDGYALFDTKHTTNRSSVALGPHGGRDYLSELMKAADVDGRLKKGTYFSMPEWFNPDYAKYGWGNWPGGEAKDIYHHGEYEPYTGRLEIDDYIEDLQLEQMRILARDYKTDIMWCDIGGSNHSSVLASEWYRNATREGRQVAMNNRCGVAPDFSTPEYSRFATVQSQKWETCEGIDPYSFGYNRRTKDNEYRSAEEIIHNLVDITAKNGNYLLNVGPDGHGQIVKPQMDRLLEAGRWLKKNGAAIYDTFPFTNLPELIDQSRSLNIRFTRTQSSLFIISLTKPSAPTFIVPAKLPILKGDTIHLLGCGSGKGKHKTHKEEEELDWVWSEKNGGELRISVGRPEKRIDRGSLAWVFEIRHRR